ncbi:predicted protein [Histoplasma capsulatum H143]|uniref:Uncharacterized protein n=1 Tax=Ajellomyces capsulatus (strain H143) TaxID=544712 RepID=C6HT97_AJECH|nr:predicted protein [Histoplasma capsulatum H143]
MPPYTELITILENKKFFTLSQLLDWVFYWDQNVTPSSDELHVKQVRELLTFYCTQVCPFNMEYKGETVESALTIWTLINNLPLTESTIQSQPQHSTKESMLSPPFTQPVKASKKQSSKKQAKQASPLTSPSEQQPYAQ